MGQPCVFASSISLPSQPGALRPSVPWGYLRDGRQGCNDFGWLWETGKRRGPDRKVLPPSLAPCAGRGVIENIARALSNSWAKVDSKTCKKEASQVVWHKDLFGCQIFTCIDLGTVRLFQHGVALQESSWTQPQCLVSFARAVGGGEAIPACHEEPVWGCVGSRGTLSLGECLAALVVPAGGQQLLLPALRLLSPAQHWPSKLLCMSRCLPLEISRCCSPVRLETAPFLHFSMCWVRHLCCAARLLLACTRGQEELT